MDDPIELLDRQVAFLLDQTDDIWFLMQLDPFLRVLRGDPILDAYLSDMTNELLALVEPLKELDAELLVELVELRKELVELIPSLDDSDMEAPADNRSPASIAYLGSLTHFDKVAAQEPRPFNVANAEGGTATVLLNILHGKDQHYQLAKNPGQKVELASDGTDIGVSVSQVQPITDEVDEDRLDAWRQRLGNVDRRYQHLRRSTRVRAMTSDGLAIAMLQSAWASMNPPLRLFGPDYGLNEMVRDTFDWVASLDYFMAKAIDGPALSLEERQLIAEKVAELRTATKRLHEGLRRRIGVTRSRLAMINRFKLRCEWHDRDRISRVADNEDLPGGPEDRLTAELALYLFDQGLSPVTKPLTGGLEPDLLDPLARFYVEAKQYKDSGRRDIVGAVAQMVDGVGRLRGGPYEVDEAFCVIFRRSGAYYDFPRFVDTETFRVHLVLVDVAPADKAGRRQDATPVHISADELIAEYQRQAAAREENDAGKTDLLAEASSASGNKDD